MSDWEIKDFVQLLVGYVYEDKAAASKQLEEDMRKFLSAGGEIEKCPSAERGEISEKVKTDLRQSLKFYEERNMTKAQKEKRRLKEAGNA